MKLLEHINNDIHDFAEWDTISFKEGYLDDPSLNEFHPAELLTVFCQNLWKAMAREDGYNDASSDFKDQLINCWRRRTDLLLKEVANLYPDTAVLTRSEIEEGLWDQGTLELLLPVDLRSRKPQRLNCPGG